MIRRNVTFFAVATIVFSMPSLVSAQTGTNATGGATSVDQGSALQSAIGQGISQQAGITQQGVQSINTLNAAEGGFVGGTQGFVGGVDGGQGGQQTIQSARGGGGAGGGGRGGQAQRGNFGSSTQRRVIRPRVKIGFNFPTATPKVNNSLRGQFSKLNTRTRGRFSNVRFNVDEKGLVTVTGNVDNLESKQVAIAYIRLEPGVRKIKNEIKIGPATESASTTPGSTGNSIDDLPSANTPLNPPSNPVAPTPANQPLTPEPEVVPPAPEVIPIPQANQLPQANVPPLIIR